MQRLSVTAILKAHRGCVNSVFWDPTGQLLVSGSDDHRIVITDPFAVETRLVHKTVHRANIFSAKFLPCDDFRKVVSCSGDGIVAFNDLNDHADEQVKSMSFFECHNLGTTYEVMVIPSEFDTFMSCGEDATVRLYDLREASSCHESECTHNILINGPAPITTMDLSPISGKKKITVYFCTIWFKTFKFDYISQIEFVPFVVSRAENFLYRYSGLYSIVE